VRQQLNLNANQFNSLNRSYLDAWSNFNRGMTAMNNNLTEQQRAQQLQQLQNRFDQEFTRSVDTTFSDPRFRTRFNQLSWQFQGPAAFNDPMIRQQLNLTPQQQREFRRLAGEWRQQIQRLRRSGNDANQELTQQQFAQLQQQLQDQMMAVLTPQQQRVWPQIYGTPFVYPFNSFFDDLPNPVPAPGVSDNPIEAGNPALQNQQATQPGTANQGGQSTVR
jgi:hypothetical protein